MLELVKIPSAARRIEFLYVENLGGISRGTVDTGTSGALLFPPTQYVADGQADLSIYSVENRQSPVLYRNIDTGDDDFAQGVFVGGSSAEPCCPRRTEPCGSPL